MTMRALSIAATVATSAVALTAFVSTNVQAQSVEQFYKGQAVKMIMGAAPGGGADLYARILIKHLPKHVPGNPTFVIVNQPGAGGLVAAGGIQNTAPKDGSTIGFLQRNNVLEPVLSATDTGFDPRRVAWLGSLSRDTYVIFSWHTSGAKTFKDATEREIILGNTGGTNENVTFPLLLNQTVGAKFKLVRGYKGSDDIALAIERGEVQGRAISWTTLKGDHAAWMREKKVNILVQFGMRRNPDIPDVPLALDFVKSEEDRRIFELMFAPLDSGRPFAAPIDVPADRIAALRKAFVDVAANPEFRAEVAQRGGTIELMTGEDIQALVGKLYQTPPALIQKVRTLLRAK